MLFVSASTLRIFIAAVTLFVVMLGGTYFLYAQLLETATVYEDQVQLVANAQNESRVANRLQEILVRSADDREALDDYFLDAVQVAQFLETIEQYAERNNILLDSKSLGTGQPNDLGVTTISVPYELIGSEADIKNFVAIMETLPYQSELRRLRLQRSVTGEERASAELEVSISYIQYD